MFKHARKECNIIRYLYHVQVLEYLRNCHVFELKRGFTAPIKFQLQVVVDSSTFVIVKFLQVKHYFNNFFSPILDLLESHPFHPAYFEFEQ